MQVLVNVASHRELLWQFLLRNVKSQHKGSYLGAFWLVANPLLMLSLYTFVFGVVFGGRFGAVEGETTLDYAFGVFLGLSVINLFSSTLAVSPGVILGQPNFVKKVVFPVEILPLAQVGSLVYNMSISMILCLVGVMAFGDGLSWQVLWIPFVLAPVLLLSIGMAWFLAALGVFLRDVAHLTQFLGMVFLYASGVFYSSSNVLEKAPQCWAFLEWNPLIHVIESLRRVTLWGQDINFSHLGYAWGFSLVVLLFGAWTFQALRPGFADAL